MGKSLHPDDRSISADEYEMMSADERRASCRYPVKELPALIGWYAQNNAPMEPPRPPSPAPATAPAAALALLEAELLPDTAGETPPRPKSFAAAISSPAIKGRGLLGRRRGPLPAAPSVRTDDPRSSLVRRDSAEPVLAPPFIEPPAPASESRIPAPPIESADDAPAAVLRSCGALMLDLSQTGALLLSEAPPPAGQPIWIRLEDAVTTEWIETSLAGISAHEPGSYLVRVAFRESCPYDLFKQIVYGVGPR